MANNFAEYVYRRMVLMDYELPALPPFDQREIDEALASGNVIRAPVSVHRDEGHMYWSHDQLVELGLALTAERTAGYHSRNGKMSIIGTVEGVRASDPLLSDRKTATMALVAGRYHGVLKEYDLGGVSVFVIGKIP